MVSPRPYFQRFGNIGCLIVGAWLLVSLVSGAPWYLVLIGVAFGLLLITSALTSVSKRWPRPPVLEAYVPGTYPGDLPHFADLLEQVAAASEWTPEIDRKLETAKGTTSYYDDWFVGAAVDLGEICKALLQGAAPPRKSGLDPNLTLDELRTELRATAGDIRIAVKAAGLLDDEGKPLAR